jgi:uncharacterized membrane protein
VGVPSKRISDGLRRRVVIAALALTAALFYGAADFLGGLASRRTASLRVLLISAPVGLVPLVVFAVHEPWPSTSVLLYGFGSGLGAAGGLLLLYRALSVGRMNVVAPVSAAVAAAVPVLVGLVLGERPAAAALLGVALALVAVGIVSRTPGAGGGDLATGLGLAVCAGVGFGMFFVLLFPVRNAGVAPLLVVRLTTCLVVLVAAAWSGQLALPPRRIWPAAAAGGLLEVTAHLCYLAAVRHGMLALVAVLSSLYPVSTVLLARIVLRERFGGAQVVGLGLAMLGVTLIGLTG